MRTILWCGCLFIPALMALTFSTLSGRMWNEMRNKVAATTTTALIQKSGVHTSSNQEVADSSFGLVDCQSLLNNANANDDPNQGQVISRYTTHDFHISLHVKSFDPTRYAILHYGFYYEKGLSQAFEDVQEDGIVLDVGSNIGWFSILARNRGYTVHSFEPSTPNVLRMCQSYCLNQWLSDWKCPSHLINSTAPLPKDRTTHDGRWFIHQVGVKDEPGTLFLTFDKNPGAARLSSNADDSSTNTTLPSVQVITLDDLARSHGWISNNISISILKIDVESYEQDVLEGASRLVASQQVKNIFIEGNMVGRRQKDDLHSITIQLVQAGYEVYKLGWSIGPTDVMPPLLTNSTVQQYKNYIFWACRGFGKIKPPKRQCNMWWRLRRNHNESTV